MFQWCFTLLSTSDHYKYTNINNPFPISIKQRFGCSAVHIGESQAIGWMCAFIDGGSSEFWSISMEDHKRHDTIDSLGCSVIFIGI